ncbi:16S rRNA (cytidine(1402)-2'-O)-methyltransferase [Halothermothrix orenii]|uniref:Ribosomal RNA small subunit methyltransferase I n=1 Tax=Halothermothrix orenii (strain H 168 / OCM 544 / DSM 9562) TaxID=373903 RepID=B8CZS5_HALOH|nr:16S rRNA (cytidine(1402)-2'-O)-methyltransferase [Halothermothrix orenii]ACL70777.1 Uroporphyrin-III C/tetrapyrrole (Corrin/Porphyrin) methyltransferase [Halothermothrix orenii H 168]
MNKIGKLYICGTPLGNLEDISFRAIKTLKEVDLVAAEDTRRTVKLLNYYDISTPLTSYHEHNEEKKSEELINKLEEGQKIALVSDAGMPGISDPGLILIQKVIDRGFKVIPVPGPTAAVSALVVSGFDTDRFVFEGFLPRRGKTREERLKDIKNEKRTIIIYESPHRLKKTLRDLHTYIPERRIALIRELTKVYEEKMYGTPSELLEEATKRKIKGELVIVIEGGVKENQTGRDFGSLSVVDHIKMLMDKGYTKKKAIKEVSRVRGLPKKEVYKKAVVIKARPEKR